MGVDLLLSDLLVDIVQGGLSDLLKLAVLPLLGQLLHFYQHLQLPELLGVSLVALKVPVFLQQG